MESVRGSLTKTIATMSELAAEEFDAPVPPAAVAPPMPGELLHFWFVYVPSVSGPADEIQLPSWMNDGIDCTISKWVTERAAWDTEINRCLKKGLELSPKRQAAYDDWRETPERRCS